MFKVALRTERRVTIAKPIAEVFAAVANFGTWRAWSPWLCQEPACPVTIEGTPGAVGHSQAWEGSFIGAGRMAISRAVQHSALDYDLTFLRPFKSTARASFRFAADGDRTTVTWKMDGSLPVFLFFLKKMMVAMIGRDYERGLKMLAEHLETGAVLSEVTVGEVRDEPGFSYVGTRRVCQVSDVGDTVGPDFVTLADRLEAGDLPEPDRVMSITHAFDVVSGECEITAAYAYRVAPTAPEGMTVSVMPGHRALHVQHKGAYHHLGNAWAAAMGCARGQHKIDKGRAAYEVYINDPRETSEAERLVDVCVPVK